MLRISLDKPSYSSGETIFLTVAFHLEKPVKARGIFIRLTCFERKIVKVSKVLDQYDLDRAAELGVPYSGMIKWRDEEQDSMLYDKELQIAPEGEYAHGVHEARISIPADAKPSSKEFGHDNKITVWKLSAKLDIPLAHDVADEKEITVGSIAPD